MDKDNFNANVDFVRGQADMIVLSALADDDKYGLEILNAIQERSQGMYSLKQATLYSSLKRLEKNGYVHSYDGDVSNGAKRVYYGLTEQGREHLNNDKSYWEFCNFLMSSLISDNKFDPVNEEKPFDPADFRPLTRRNKSASDKENVIIKYVYLNQEAPTDEKGEFANRTEEDVEETEETKSLETNNFEDYDGNKQVSANDEDVVSELISEYKEDSAETQSSPAEEVTDETLEIYSDSEIEDSSALETQSYPIDVLDSFSESQTITSTETSTQAQESTDFEEKLAKIVEDLAEIKEKINNSQQSASTILTEEENLLSEEASAQSEEMLQSEQVIIDESEQVNKQVQSSTVENQENVFDDNAQDRYNREYQNYEEPKPSPLYQSKRYFDEDNEVNYVTSFSDMFNSIEDDAIIEDDKEEIEYLTMKEMVYKFHAKGVKIRPYDKKDTMEFYVNRYYYSNKLHLHTSLIIFAVLFVELLFSHLICNRNDANAMPAWALILAVIAVGLYPLARYVLYIIDPTKKTPATFNLKTALLISLLPVITLPIVIALLAFVQFGANIHDYASMERTIVLPIFLLFNIPLYFVVYAVFYRTYKYHIN